MHWKNLLQEKRKNNNRKYFVAYRKYNDNTICKTGSSPVGRTT
uniref:Uncharacterized protein n=1 Tax=Ackermannviridae sp. TaxID=2831612 RepID=A0A8S5RRB9_9CAUD|nr:MAG TPA: hypothetical protein [Ackermannviridae sp.]